MKKLFLILSLIFLLYSCGGDNIISSKNNYLKVEQNFELIPNNSDDMNEINTFNKFEELHYVTPILPELPTIHEINKFEEKYNIVLPKSYRKYLLEYSNLNVGTYETFMINKPEFPYIDYDINIKDARNAGLPNNYFPFLSDNGNYFCFDLNTNINSHNYNVVFWSHNGMFKEERWDNFIDWMNKDWIYGVEE